MSADSEEELFLTQSSFLGSLEARSWQLDFLRGWDKSDSQLGFSENAVSGLFDFNTPKKGHVFRGICWGRGRGIL